MFNEKQYSWVEYLLVKFEMTWRLIKLDRLMMVFSSFEQSIQSSVVESTLGSNFSVESRSQFKAKYTEAKI